MNSFIQSNTILPFLVATAVVCFLRCPLVQAVVPAPDGGYPGGNTAEGQAALFSLTTGTYNTAAGFYSLRSNTEGKFNTATGAGALLANTSDENTATGAGALLSNTTGDVNTANGAFALFSNTEGSSNTATGDGALFFNSTGSFNTAAGATALFNNTEGAQNTAMGCQALLQNSTGGGNTATGSFALLNNTFGNDNTATGAFTLVSNTTGVQNTANGFGALRRNGTGDSNTAIGADALLGNLNGIANTAVGYQALLNNNGSVNTAVGENALQNNTTGVQNLGLGVAAGGNITTANNVICIGSQVSGVNVSNSCFIGNIRGVPTGIGDAVSVVIDSNGQLGTQISSRRFKREIKPMDRTSEAILALKPVTFHYKSDNTNRLQFGLIAEEVAEINPDLVVRDKDGEIYTVRYDAVNAMLLNEFLKEHNKVEAQQATISDLKSVVTQQQKGMEVLATQLKEQAAELQRVSDQIEKNSPHREWCLIRSSAIEETAMLHRDRLRP